MQIAAMSHAIPYTIGTLLWAWLLCVAGGTSTLAFAEPRVTALNDIELLVDDVLVKTWHIDELMVHRIDWQSPQKRFFPAVPVTSILFDPASGLLPETMASITFYGVRDVLHLRRQALANLSSLLLKLDIDRGGEWKLGASDHRSEQLLAAANGLHQIKLKRLRRIELRRQPDNP